MNIQFRQKMEYCQNNVQIKMEEFGRTGGALQRNQARLYMDAVRRRKGLPTEDVIVVFAEKQRNLKRNKWELNADNVIFLHFF